MSTSSILGGDDAATHTPGKDVDALGPSDTSDSGSDVQGERSMATGADNPGEWGALTADGGSDSDAFGTGERASADGDETRDAADILPDRIIDGRSPRDAEDREFDDQATEALADDEAAGDEDIDALDIDSGVEREGKGSGDPARAR